MTSPAARRPGPEEEAGARHSKLAGAIERVIFSSRWLLAPLYLGLIISMLLLLSKFGQDTFELARRSRSEDSSKLITDVLALVDLLLIGNLLVMVMFAGYENFVARFSTVTKEKRPNWMGSISFGTLKQKLMTSIVAIAAIHVLEDFTHVSDLSDRELGWGVGILLAFVVSGALLALMDRLSGGDH